MIGNIDIQKHQINPQGKILDVGCGCYPFVREGADITYIDLYPEKNVSRKYDFVKVPNLIKMDIQDMGEFKDKEFDFIISGDILEHVPDPAKACREIIRVGKAGWVRCPTVLFEMLFGHKRPYHLWATNLINDVLVFYPKDHYFVCWDYPDDFKDKMWNWTLHRSFEWQESFKFKILEGQK